MRTFSIGLAAAGLLGSATLAAPFTIADKKGEVDSTVMVKAADAPPPGTVAVKGGRTKVGSKPKAIEELLQTESYQGLARTLDGETPQHDVTVKPFYVGKYEVTNEQYMQFITATGHRPPEHWGQDAIQAAQTEFGRLEAEKAKAAKDAGETYKRQRWNDTLKQQWWAKNWKEAEWGIPKGLENAPVVFVDYRDARAYCEWAGVRLPEESEWVHAARAGKDQWFPWGDEWEAQGRAHTTEIKRKNLFPVGSFPNGASPYGVHDMSGSVWEWTTGPYSAYPRFKPNKYKVKKAGNRKETLEPTPKWDSNQRVVMGGAFQFGLLAARVTTRRATDRTQTTDGLGFRIAASEIPGRDKADAIFRGVVRNSGARQGGESFDLDEVVGLDRWTSAPVEGKRPEDYGVISGYEHILFVPRNELSEAPGGELETASRITPLLFGFFSTTVPFAEPALPPGQYLVAYRGKGPIKVDRDAKDEEKEDKGEGEEEEAPAEVTDDTPLELLTPAQRLLRQIDLKENLIIFMDAETGEYVASMKTKKAAGQKDKKNTPKGVVHEKRTVWVGQLAKDKVQEDHDFLIFDVKVRRTAKSRVIPLHLEMRVENDTIGSGWRK